MIALSLISTASAAYCGKLGGFDAMCVNDGVVFIVSISPCHGKDSPNKIDRTVYLTIIDTRDNMKKYSFAVKEIVRKPLSFGE